MPELIATTLLGQDDWLFYGRTANGVLVYTSVETDWHWLEAPHKGGADVPAMQYVNSWFGSAEFREDSKWMHDHVAAHLADYYWEECGYDTDGSYMGWPPEKDAEFIAASRKTYFPKES